MELAYLWPSFNNGYSLYDLLTPAQLELSRQMVRYWGAFVATGAPEVARPAALAAVHKRAADVPAARWPDAAPSPPPPTGPSISAPSGMPGNGARLT